MGQKTEIKEKYGSGGQCYVTDHDVGFYRDIFAPNIP